MLQIHRGHGQHGNAVALNQEGILVHPVRGAPVLDDAQTPRQNRFGDLVVEQDDAVRNVLFEAVAGQSGLPAFAGDDGGEISVLEPAEQAPQFGPQIPIRCRARRTGPRRCRGAPFWLRSNPRHDQGGRTGPPDRTRRSPRSGSVPDRRDRSASFFRAIRSGRSKPSEATLLASSSAVSSKERQTPGSSNSVAPRTRNSIPSSVLPQPALPQTRVGRPRGRPPSVISSSPWMPVGHLERPPERTSAVLDFKDRISRGRR